MKSHVTVTNVSALLGLLATFCAWSSAPAFAAQIQGQVLGGGAPIVDSAVTLWSASGSAPRALSQAWTGADGRFVVRTDAKDANLYLVANGGRPAASKTSTSNPGLALMAVLGSGAPAKVVINEMATIASVWTHAQFLDGTVIKGSALGLRIAAGNVPNFVDLATGGYGSTIQDALNGGQTPTMANFATLASVLAGCVTQITPEACSQLFAATTPRSGIAPTDTLTALAGVARDSR